ncbi:MAG: hypothetical protein IPL39_00450 [Opitutaceae bacterium]|nr:hypothetical protein [Opitutaceae bacterium]
MVTFQNTNRATYVPANAYDDNTGMANHGQARSNVNGGPVGYLSNGTPMPYLNPWILEGNFGQQFGGPLVSFNGDNSTPTSSLFPEPAGTFGISSTGARDNGIGGIPFARPLGLNSKSAQALAAHLPFSQFGVYKDNSLTDSSVFDFYNQLYDGPTKKEWQDFRAYNLSLAQTFFNDQIGIELTQNNEFYKSGRLSLLSDTRQALYVDINKTLLDGTSAGLNGEPFADGTPNPNVGRAYITDSLAGGSENRSEKESTRATVFATHDFSKDGKNWALRLLGKHTVTGLFEATENKSDNRSWVRYAMDDAFELATRSISTDPTKPTGVRSYGDGALRPSVAIYLGPTLLNSSTASGANLPRPTAEPTIASSTYRYFDSHWNKPTDPTAAGYVDPSAPWIYNYYPDLPNFNAPALPKPPGLGPRNSTQAENPANYVGWTNIPVGVIDSETSPENRERLTTSATLNRTRITSSAFVWQGHFWDNAVVGTWGVRKDISKAWNFSRNGSSAKQPEKARSTPTMSILTEWLAPPAARSLPAPLRATS